MRETRPARPQRAAVDQRIDAAPRQGEEPGGLADRDAARGRRVHQRLAERVLGVPLDRRHQPQRLDLVEARRGDRLQARHASGDRAGLVEGDDADAGQVLERLTALDQRAAARRGADGRDDGDGDRDHQGARARHDQQRQGAVQPGRRIGTEERGTTATATAAPSTSGV